MPAATTPHRGRPRSEKARAAILAAAAELLLERGLAGVSMDAVAQRAAVSKATIYRWWPTKEALALDAVYHDWAVVPKRLPDTGTLRGDLLALLRPWARLVRQRPYARVLAALIGEVHADPGFAEDYLARFIRPRRERAREIFTRAIARGELDPAVQVEVALDLLYGSLYHRLLHRHAPLSDRFVADVVELVLGGIMVA